MEKLREYLKAEHGRGVKLAAALGITPGAISQWEKVPGDRLVEVSKATGIPKDELRPDLFKGFVPADRSSAA